jgi:peptidoglycan/LPS O-acetylase OafA/YrhL
MTLENSANTKHPDAHRIFGLDLIRCIAILFVLLTHTLYIIDRQNVFYKIPVYSGFIGVELFFILSGFLIGTILIKIHESNKVLQLNNIKIFWIRRWFRTLPNYYLMFFIYAAIFWLVKHISVFSDMKYVSYLVFLQNTFSYHPDNFFPVAWSLSVEEWFYITFPVMLFLISRIIPGKKMQSFLIAVILYITIPLAARLFTALAFDRQWDAGFRKFVPLRLDGIGFGVLTAYIKFYYSNFWEKNTRIFFITGVILLSTCLYLYNVYYVSMFDPITYDATIKVNFFMKSLFFTIFSISIVLIMPFTYSVKLSYKSLLSRMVTLISEASYSIYLIHLLIIQILSHIIKHNNGLLFIMIWIVTITVAHFQYIFFEKRFTLLRNRFGSKKDRVGLHG